MAGRSTSDATMPGAAARKKRARALGISSLRRSSALPDADDRGKRCRDVNVAWFRFAPASTRAPSQST